MRRDTVDGAADVPLVRDPVRGPGAAHPLSPAQQRLWFLQQLRPGDPAYNIIIALELVGAVCVAGLAAATSGVIARHEALRATFGVAAARPVQWFAPARPHRPHLVDLSELPAERQEYECGRLLKLIAARRPDLGSGPIASWTLIRRGPSRHVLVFWVHHIAFDGGSTQLACHEVEELYAAGVTGRPWRLDLPVPFSAELGRQLDSGAAHAGDLDYWRNRLAGAPARVRVFPPPESARSGVRSVTFQLRGDHYEQLRRLGRRARCTPFMSLLALFASLVARCSGQEDLVIGTPIATRPFDQDSAGIGLFLNMVPLRIDLSGAPDLAESMWRVRECVLASFEHGAIPFEQLVHELRPPRELWHTPIFQIVFAYQRAPRAPRLPGLCTRLLSVDAPAPKYDLTVIATETDGCVEMTVQADRAVSDERAPALIAANFDLLLAGAVRDPSRALASLPVLGGAGAPTLGAPDPAARRVDGPAAPPGTELERAIAEAWCATLGVAVVDVRRGFFDVGGTSVLLLDLHARLRASLAPELSLADLFRFPSVESLAAHLCDHPDRANVAMAAARGGRRRAALGRRGAEGPQP